MLTAWILYIVASLATCIYTIHLEDKGKIETSRAKQIMWGMMLFPLVVALGMFLLGIYRQESLLFIIIWGAITLFSWLFVTIYIRISDY